jgi:hypothetical protein
MARLFKTLTSAAAGALFAVSATAQNASVPSSLIPTESEPPPTLVVAPPLPEPLARGAVLIPYRVENIRILPVLGMEATKVTPRAGHLHVTVDDLPWHWGDFASSNTIVIVGNAARRTQGHGRASRPDAPDNHWTDRDIQGA